ncbi:MAG: gfo/Idh/MocA family oxidoreductase [Microbacteriaceae bacterium]|nr:gfo/Idh/MocA family oxidoreductase [Microbacteriaceae bacterium]
MSDYTAAVIAAGSQGRVHAAAYRSNDIELVAVADPDLKLAEELAADLQIPRAFGGYEELLGLTHPDFVSVCTPPRFHLDVIRAAVAAGVKAIHCEKPIATSFGDVLLVQSLAEEAGVQLTFNLQRRFEPVHRFARDQIAAGTIGDVVSIEGFCPNLPDWGTHIIDLILFYLNDAPPAWVMGQVDVATNRYVYGQFAETSSLTQISWPSGIYATVYTGREPQTPVLNLANNTGLIVHGTAGRIESRGSRCLVQRFGEPDIEFATPFSTDAESWDRGVDPAIVACTAEAIGDALSALKNGTEPALSARHGVAGAEIIFATYESSRSRARIALPLESRDNALLDGLENGFWSPVGEQRSTY